MASLTRATNRAALDALTQRCQDGRRMAMRHDAADQEQLFEKALEELNALSSRLEEAPSRERQDEDEPSAVDDHALARDLLRIAQKTDPQEAPASKDVQPSHYIPGEPAPEQASEAQDSSEDLEDPARIAAALEQLVASYRPRDDHPSSAQDHMPSARSYRKNDEEPFRRDDDLPSYYQLFPDASHDADHSAYEASTPPGVLAHIVSVMQQNGCSDDTIAQCIVQCGGNPHDYLHDDAEHREIRDRLEEMNRRDEEHRQELERLARRTRPLTDEEHNEISDAEAKTDAVAQSLGVQTPRYIPGESVAGYKRRCAKLLQPHSEDWKHTDLSTLSPEVFALASRQIHHDAQAAAARPARYKDSDPIRPVIQRSPTGHTRTEYRGSFRSAFGAFMS